VKCEFEQHMHSLALRALGPHAALRSRARGAVDGGRRTFGYLMTRATQSVRVLPRFSATHQSDLQCREPLLELAGAATTSEFRCWPQWLPRLQCI
jgi:hypothetical protein